MEGSTVQGDYSELLASSIFCLVLQGDGWTARMEDAVLHGWVGPAGHLLCVTTVVCCLLHLSAFAAASQ